MTTSGCQMTQHGGEVDAAAERYGIPRDRWLDLSTGINPNPYTLPELARSIGGACRMQA